MLYLRLAYNFQRAVRIEDFSAGEVRFWASGFLYFDS